MNKEEALRLKIIEDKIPRHIAVIMDGNGRWAKQRGMPRIYGHRAGTESVREAVRVSGELGVEILTLYTFSTENWTRPAAEVGALMGLLSKMLKTEADELNKSNVKLHTIGRTEALPKNVQKELHGAIDTLKNNTGLLLNLALNYGGRQEIVDAVNQIIKSGLQKIDEKIFEKFLYTHGLKEPDLVIRTSGEQRISNFLLYQTAYSEYYSTPVLWPDFRRIHLYQAILEYQQRERRFGAAS